MSKILVVDDSAETRNCIARLLELQGHAVLTAANGRDAWVMLYANLPDLIVLDLMMPFMDGLTFLSLLRHNPFWNAVPVVILTGQKDDERLLEQARALGVSDVILKGALPPEELLNRLSRLVQITSRPTTLTVRKVSPRAEKPRLKRSFVGAQ